MTSWMLPDDLLDDTMLDSMEFHESKESMEFWEFHKYTWDPWQIVFFEKQNIFNISRSELLSYEHMKGVMLVQATLFELSSSVIS